MENKIKIDCVVGIDPGSNGALAVFIPGQNVKTMKMPTKKGPQIMSADRRVIEDREIIGLFEFYLRNWCEEHGEDTIVISNGEKKIFEARLLDFNKEK